MDAFGQADTVDEQHGNSLVRASEYARTHACGRAKTRTPHAQTHAHTHAKGTSKQILTHNC
jgi:hypothetical protein